ncbi:hypothetical protein HA402_004903 [Bradysia odoriphaga]|nr:hypothetical protein HA402_004903 [Bradysia odoriphaga]
MSYSWSPSSVHSTLPPNALYAGSDTDGSQIFVGRSFFQGDQLPCKIIPNKNAAYVSYDGGEHFVDSYEVLCGQGFQWLLSSDGNIPDDAFVAGFCKGGEPLYVGRMHFQGSLTPGKIQRSHGCLYIPFGGVEQSFQSNFEVLVVISEQVNPPQPDQPDNSDQSCCCTIM